MKNTKKNNKNVTPEFVVVYRVDGIDDRGMGDMSYDKIKFFNFKGLLHAYTQKLKLPIPSYTFSEIKIESSKYHDCKV